MTRKESKITIPTKEFKVFLSSLYNIDDRAILEVDNDKVFSIVSKSDKSLFLWAELNQEFSDIGNINMPSISKLSNLLDMIGGDYITFNWKVNKLEYRGPSLKCDYHLLDDGIIPRPKVTIKKIKSLKFDNEFTISRKFLKSIFKNSSIFKDTNKLYIYTDDGHLMWTIGDKSKSNTDCLIIKGDAVDFEMKEFITSLDNLRILEFGDSDQCNIKVNNDGFGVISIQNSVLSLQYILTSLTN
jgi:hypothetical protein